MKSSEGHLLCKAHIGLLTIFFCIYLIILSPYYLYAQKTSMNKDNGLSGGSIGILGSIIDAESREPVGGAQITLINIDTKDEFVVFSSLDGKYSIVNLKRGKYEVSVFQKDYFPLIMIEDSQSPILTFTLVAKRNNRLTGRILNGEGKYIEGAGIKIKGTSLETISGVDGIYIIDNVPKNMKTLIVSKEGYLTEERRILDSEYAEKPFNIEIIKLADPVFVGPEGATIKKADGTEVIIPKGALTDTVGIQVTIIPTKFSDVNEEGIPVSNISTNIDFKPSGQKFKKPVKVITPALLPMDLAPDADKEGEIVLYNEITGKTEKIKAIYIKKDHLITYQLEHFSRVRTAPCEYKGSQRVSKSISKQKKYTHCKPQGGENCISRTYSSHWDMTSSITSELNFEIVKITGNITTGVGNGESITANCDCQKCKEEEFWVGSRAEFEIKAYYCSPWFGWNYYQYSITKISESPDSECKQGRNCGDGQECDNDPSLCCHKVCNSGACNKYISVEKPPLCSKCDTQTGECVNDDDYDPGPCKKCQDGSVVADGSKEHEACKKCNSQGELVPDNSEDPGMCRKCSEGEVMPDNVEDPGLCKKCSGGNEVNDDTEDPGICWKCAGGSSVPDNTEPCDDGDPCTKNDRCIGGTCIGEPATSNENPNCP